MRLQFVGSAVRMNLHIIIFNMYTGGSEYRIIEGTESIEVLRVHFGGTVAAHQVVFEEDADFGYVEVLKRTGLGIFYHSDSSTGVY